MDVTRTIRYEGPSHLEVRILQGLLEDHGVHVEPAPKGRERRDELVERQQRERRELVERQQRELAELQAQQEKERRELVERQQRSEEHTSELQSHSDLVCRLLLEKKKQKERIRR